MIKSFLAGAILLNAWAISLFFFRFWKKTHDRLFIWFASAFLLLGLERLAITFGTEVRFHFYLIRLAAFLLIILAILEKNKKRSVS
jgi:hypothetical protein